jgi:hypothetical protein
MLIDQVEDRDDVVRKVKELFPRGKYVNIETDDDCGKLGLELYDEISMRRQKLKKDFVYNGDYEFDVVIGGYLYIVYAIFIDEVWKIHIDY